MRSRLAALAALCFLFLATGCLGAEPEVDREDVLRRGDSVEHTSGLIEAGEDIDDPLAPPPSDAHKWFISVVYSRAQNNGQLTNAWLRDEHLMSLANPVDDKRSWSHFKQYAIEDQSQNWRFSQIKLGALPTVIVQPPRNGQYGDPGIVVCQTSYNGRPRDLAEKISGAIKKYSKKFIDGARRQAEPEYVIPPYNPGPYSQYEQCPGPYCPAPDPNAPPPWNPDPNTPIAPVTPVLPYPNGPIEIPPVDALGGSIADLVGTILKWLLAAVLSMIAGGGTIGAAGYGAYKLNQSRKKSAAERNLQMELLSKLASSLDQPKPKRKAKKPAPAA